MNDKVTLSLTEQEALVLLAWLMRTDEAESRVYEDEAEERVLWRLEGQLERLLVAPFLEDHEQMLSTARKVVRESSNSKR